MAANSSPWTTISLHPLTGPLDTRSRPADIGLGSFRHKLNWAVNTDGKLCRRAGHERFFSDFDPYTNHDHHRRGRTRKPITFLYQCSDNDGVRHLFDGTENDLSKLNYTTGEWTDILTGVGSPGAYWNAATLQNKVFATNNVDNVYCYDLTTGLQAIPELTTPGPTNGVGITAAKVVVEYQGVIMVMNIIQDGVRNVARIEWSDLNDGTSWIIGKTVGSIESIAGYADLDYGDAILAAVQIQGDLYIWTRNAIWRCTVAGTDSGVFNFRRIYCEPENQAKCLAYERTIVSTGSAVFYLGRDTAYTYNPYLPEPERADQQGTDWLHRATGVIYKTDTKLDANFCRSPVARFVPAAREIWFSWPSAGQNGVNNWTLVGHIDQRTADVVDTGYTAFVNERRNSTNEGQCNETQNFLGASGRDYAIKSIGTVFLREWVTLGGGDPANDIPVATYYDEGYRTQMRGLVPTGFNDREKIINLVQIDDDTAAQDVPAVCQLRIGNAPTNVDPNDEDDVCTPLWNDIGAQKLACVDLARISSLKAAGQRADVGIEWSPYEQGRFLFFEFTIKNPDGTPAIGADTCWSRIDFNVMALPKP